MSYLSATDIRDLFLPSLLLLAPPREAITAINLCVPNEIWKVIQLILENLYQLWSLPACLISKYTFDCNKC